MKNKFVAFVVFCFLQACFSSAVFGQGTAFTYQGLLLQSNSPANGVHELRFSVHDNASGGNQVAGPLTIGTNVANGLFTVTLDFGSGVFTGAERWLGVEARPGGSPGAFTVLPRQRILPVPYAIFAAGVSASGISGVIPSGNIANGSVTTTKIQDNTITPNDLNATAFDTTFWKVEGNAGTTPAKDFVGTLDNQPLSFRVNRALALRLAPHPTSPNVIGGHGANFMGSGAMGAVIGGGGDGTLSNGVDAAYGTVGGGLGNSIQTGATHGTIGGGAHHTIRSNTTYGTIGGGRQNSIGGNALYPTISGGIGNSIGEGGDYGVIAGGIGNGIRSNATYGVIGGGDENAIALNAVAGVIAGGYDNNIRPNAQYATIPGGRANTATNYAFAAGRRAKADHEGSFVWADSQDVDFGSAKSNTFLIRASGGVGIGKTNPAAALDVNGTVLASTGTLASVSYGFQNDSNTGLFSPAANTIGLATAGAERMRVEPAGNVGIGTNNPAEMLHVRGNILATGTITPNSDRNAKTNITPIDTRMILEQLLQLPLSQWRFHAEGEDVRHIGPMAQDFKKAFGLGAHQTAIATVDADGVALAAIQGMHRTVREELERKEKRIRELEERIGRLERVVGGEIREGED